MTGLYTKDQMLKVIYAWRVAAELPRKGQQIVVTFPQTDQYQFGQATLSINDGPPATYGGKLYKVVYSKPRAQTVVNTMLDEIPPKASFMPGGGGTSFPIAGGGMG